MFTKGQTPWNKGLKGVQAGPNSARWKGSLNLIIECDGDYWHKYPIGRDIDHVRTSELISKGFKVLRLWEREIRKMSLDDLKTKIYGG